MAANTMVCTNATVAGSDPDFTITKVSQNHGEGLYIYFDLSIGTAGSLTLTIDVMDESLGSTTVYRMISVSGTAASALTYVFSATGKYRIPVPLGINETSITINATYGSSGADATCDMKIMEG